MFVNIKPHKEYEGFDTKNGVFPIKDEYPCTRESGKEFVENIIASNLKDGIIIDMRKKSKVTIIREEKRVWEPQYACTGCDEWFYSESEADACCEHGVYELSVCSWCWNHIDHCECEVPEHMEG